MESSLRDFLNSSHCVDSGKVFHVPFFDGEPDFVAPHRKAGLVGPRCSGYG
jgi:hypothetical protein